MHLNMVLAINTHTHTHTHLATLDGESELAVEAISRLCLLGHCVGGLGG